MNGDNTVSGWMIDIFIESGISFPRLSWAMKWITCCSFITFNANAWISRLLQLMLCWSVEHKISSVS